MSNESNVKLYGSLQADNCKQSSSERSEEFTNGEEAGSTNSDVAIQAVPDGIVETAVNSKASYCDGHDTSYHGSAPQIARQELFVDKMPVVEALMTHCKKLEQTCSLLEAHNRTLENDVEQLKTENTMINTKLLSIMTAVAKLSVRQNSSSAEPAMSQGLHAATKADAGNVSGQHSVENQKTTVEQKQHDEERERLAAAAVVELQLQTFSQKLVESDKSVKELTARLTVMDGKADWLELELQRYVRRHSLIIENFCPKEDRTASDIFLLFAKSVLGVPVDEADIDSLHLIDRPATSSPSKQSGLSPEKRPRPVLITFTCYKARAHVYKAWLSFRTGSMTDSASKSGTLSGERGQGLCIKEFLTESQEGVYKQAAEARERKRIADCWTFKGKTFIKTLTGEIKEFINQEESIPKDASKYNSCTVM